MRSKVICAAFILAGAFSTSVARADIIVVDASVPLQPTNFTTSVSIPKFDTNLGILNSVTFVLDGHVEGSARFESLDSEPATIDMELAAQITLQRPDMSSLVVALPLVMTSDNATAFDIVIDFGGTSGKSYENLTADDLEMFTTFAPTDLLLFSGPGSILLPVLGEGASTGSGAGNLLLQFATSASADVRVIYDYTVPEPATAGLMGLGLLGFVRRTRRNRVSA